MQFFIKNKGFCWGSILQTEDCNGDYTPLQPSILLFMNDLKACCCTFRRTVLISILIQ